MFPCSCCKWWRREREFPWWASGWSWMTSGRDCRDSVVASAVDVLLNLCSSHLVNFWCSELNDDPYDQFAWQYFHVMNIFRTIPHSSTMLHNSSKRQRQPPRTLSRGLSRWVRWNTSDRATMSRRDTCARHCRALSTHYISDWLTIP